MGGIGCSVFRRDFGSRLGTEILSHVESYFQSLCLRARYPEQCISVCVLCVILQKCVFRNTPGSRRRPARAAPGSSHTARRSRLGPRGSHVVRGERERGGAAGGGSAGRETGELRESSGSGKREPGELREPQPCSAARWTTASASSSRTAWRSGSGACSWWWETAARTRYGRAGAAAAPQGLLRSAPVGIKPCQPQAEQRGLRGGSSEGRGWRWCVRPP